MKDFQSTCIEKQLSMDTTSQILEINVMEINSYYKELKNIGWRKVEV